jgi:hypothetical protein
MNDTDKYSGFAIALAWPQTFCKQPPEPAIILISAGTMHLFSMAEYAVRKQTMSFP